MLLAMTPSPLRAATYPLGRAGWAAVAQPSPSACSGVISTTPASPRPGTLFLVHVSGAGDSTSLTGRVAGEPLHFSADSSGVRTAYAAVPIDSNKSLGIIVACTSGGVTDTLRRTLSLTPGKYAVERLNVAPKFGEQPDSALAARLAREARRASDVSLLAHDTPRLWTLPFIAPRTSRVTSKFGGGREFNGKVTSRHMGTDYAGAEGAPIRATNRGIVRLVDSFFLGGNVVYVDHGEGLVTAYLHQSKTLVAVGDTVERGEVLGRVGATGRVTGPHLHFIVRYGSISIDPQQLLALLGNSNSAEKSRPARTRKQGASSAH